MKLRVNYALASNEEGETMTINTSLHRELQYNIEHAVHHLAIIKIGIKSLEDSFKLDDNFGIAASTIRNKKRMCTVSYIPNNNGFILTSNRDENPLRETESPQNIKLKKWRTVNCTY